jgi:hypothetical protein
MLLFKKLSFFILPVLLGLSIACSEDDPAPGGSTPTGQSKTYIVDAVVDPALSGVVTFIENNDNSTTIEIALQNTPDNGVHPAHIHFNSAAETGGIAITLVPVDGTNGTSTTTVSQLDNGTLIGYAELLNFDGYLNVHLSPDNLGTIVGQTDIGANELTGESKIYILNSVDVPSISGTATFEKRNSGETLATLSLDNTPEGGTHPVHIHENTTTEGGGILFSFNPVNGDTGLSKTNISEQDDGTPLLYEDLLSINGHIKGHLSPEDLQTVVASGDIGQNELTGDSMTYELSEAQVPGISGTVSFSERQNSSTLVTILLSGTPEEGSHPAHIHINNAATGGGIAISLNDVNGATGLSYTQVNQLNSGETITYNELVEFNGHVNVHLSSEEITTIVAQGDIGSNSGEGAIIEYEVTSSGSSAYIFNGNGLSGASNPPISLKRGFTYVFKINAPGHPFYINSTQGTGTGMAYSNGVTNNGAETGDITFVVPNDAPSNLFYNCEFHAAMTNTIAITN